jgi:putative ABC transport system permease protein
MSEDMETIFQDLRYGWRILVKNPGFTAIAVLTLAIGIGASSAIFSVVDTVLLRPLPYEQPERLVLVTETLPGMTTDEVGVSAGEYQDYRDRNHSFSHIAAYERSGFNLTGAGQPLRISAAAVSASVFPLLGVSPELGRAFTADEDRYGSGNVVVLSHSLWEHEYGRDPNILGKTVKLDEHAYTVVGVMPPSFRFPFDGAPLSEMADLWVPIAFAPDRLSPDNRLREFGVGMVGRLKAGVTREQAQADVESIAAVFMKQYGYSGTLRVVPRAYVFAAHTLQKARPLVMLLVLAVGCVLLIACANVANLLLARGNHRSHEMAIRGAVGAGRGRIARQCLVESAMLSLCGAGAGIIVAEAAVEGLRRFGPNDVPRLHDVTLHPTVLLFALALSLVTAILFGVIPAWKMSHVSPQESLKESARTGTARSAQRLQNSVATMEIATALVLLLAGGLLLRSFVRLLDSPFGFDPRGKFVVRTLFDESRYPDPSKRQTVQKELLNRLSHLPGVTTVAAASHLPLSDARQIGFRLEHAAADDYHFAENSLVSPGYFRAMGIPLLQGRDFTGQDRPDTPNVAIVSQTLAKQYFPGQNPIGQRFQWGDRAFFTIVGVASDVHISTLDADPPPMIYDSMFQTESGASERTAFVLRSNEAAQGLFQEVQRQVWSVDKDLPIYNTTSLTTLVSESLAQRRFSVLLLGSFAVIALVLAAIGLFGVISYLVAERTREFGVRMALGADHISIYWEVLRCAALIGMAGCGLGLPLSLFATRLLQANLYHVSRFDVATTVLVPALLLSVALFAAYWPARRATKIDLMVALRYE